MKVDVATTRDDAALELGMFLGTPYAWELFDLNGYDSSTRIVPVSEDEPFDRVVNEHMRQGGRTLVAVFFPGREGMDRFEFLQWEPATTEKPKELEDADRIDFGRGPDGHYSSIGMVADVMLRKPRHFPTGREALTAPATRLLDVLQTEVFTHA